MSGAGGRNLPYHATLSMDGPPGETDTFNATVAGPARQRPGWRGARACLAVAVVASLLLQGCAIQAGPLRNPSAQEGATRSCTRIVRVSAAPPAEVDTAQPSRPAAAAPPVPGFSQSATNIAEVIGARESLEQMALLASQAGDPASAAVGLERLSVRQSTTDAILRAMLDVSSVLADLDCQNERGDQLRDHLQKLEDRRTRQLSLGSILVGALTAIVSGGLSLAYPTTNGGDVAAMIGGTLEASVGVAAVFGTVSGELPTERNLMGEVWEGPSRSTLFPPTVWRFLNQPVGGATGRFTLRDVVIAQWRMGERLGREGSQEERDRIALLFGRGGTYTLDDLNARDTMLDLLKVSVASMNQDLQLLLDELVDRSRAAARQVQPPPPARPPA